MDGAAQKINLSRYRINSGRGIALLPLEDCPLAIAAAGLIGGVISEYYFRLPRALWVGLCTLAVGCCVLCMLKRKLLGVFLIASFTAAFLLGAARMYHSITPGPNDISSIVGKEPVLATVKGIVANDPVKSSRDENDSDNYSLSFELDITGVLTEEGLADAAGRIYARLSYIPSNIAAVSVAGKGDAVTFYCRLERPKRAAYRWQFDFGQYLYYRNIDVCGYAQYPALIVENYSGKVHAATEVISSDFEHDAVVPLIEAITLGRRRNLPDDVVDAFRTTGLMHILSLSGMHMGIIVCGLWALLRLCSIRERFAALILAAGITFFLFNVEIRPPIIRAAVIAYVFALARIFARKTHPINVLSLAVIITLLINPRHIFSAGWQLSFACVLGIILFTLPITNYFLSLKYEVFDLWFSPARTANMKAPDLGIVSLRRIRKWLLLAVSASLAAWISSAPLLLYHFGVVYPFSWAYTVAIIPLVWLTINFAFLSMILWSGFGLAANGLASILIHAVKLFSRMPFNEILVGYPPLYIVLLAANVLIVWGLSRFILSRWMRYASRAITVLFLLLVVNWNADEFSSNEFRVALLPVGHGQCAVLEMPGGDKYVFDCGSSTFYDCGRRIAAPYLRSRRIRNITALIISHPHEDHVNGIDGLLEAVKTDSIYINADCQNKGFYGDVVEYEKAAVFDGKGRWMLEILPPLSEYESLNDRCLAVLINCGQMSILLPADIEKQRQTELINLGINADVLATPHHGSKVTSLNDLAEKMTVSGVISTADEDMFALKIITVK